MHARVRATRLVLDRQEIFAVISIGQRQALGNHRGRQVNIVCTATGNRSTISIIGNVSAEITQLARVDGQANSGPQALKREKPHQIQRGLDLGQASHSGSHLS